MGVAPALRILVHPSEIEAEHRARIEVVGHDSELLGHVDAQFRGERPPAGLLEPGEELAVSIAVPLGLFAQPKDGSYVVNILLNGMHQVSLPIRASVQQPPAFLPEPPALPA